jgi:hypothetical protein
MVNIALIPLVIPRSEKVGPKPLYVCPRCSIHTYSNNMIQMQCSIKHNNYLLHNDPWVLKGLHKCSRTKLCLSLHRRGGEACLTTVFRILLIAQIAILEII